MIVCTTTSDFEDSLSSWTPWSSGFSGSGKFEYTQHTLTLLRSSRNKREERGERSAEIKEEEKINDYFAMSLVAHQARTLCRLADQSSQKYYNV